MLDKHVYLSIKVRFHVIGVFVLVQKLVSTFYVSQLSSCCHGLSKIAIMETDTSDVFLLVDENNLGAMDLGR